MMSRLFPVQEEVEIDGRQKREQNRKEGDKKGVKIQSPFLPGRPTDDDDVIEAALL